NPFARSETGTAFSLATRRRRTRSADSTLNMSLTSSNVTVISGAIGRPRSSLRACSRARRKNPSAPSAVTHTLAFLFIFAPPQLFHFPLKLLDQRFIIRKLYGSCERVQSRSAG